MVVRSKFKRLADCLAARATRTFWAKEHQFHRHQQSLERSCIRDNAITIYSESGSAQLARQVFTLFKDPFTNFYFRKPKWTKLYFKLAPVLCTTQCARILYCDFVYRCKILVYNNSNVSQIRTLLSVSCQSVLKELIRWLSPSLRVFSCHF